LKELQQKRAGIAKLTESINEIEGTLEVLGKDLTYNNELNSLLRLKLDAITKEVTGQRAKIDRARTRYEKYEIFTEIV
jgi:hypothetical protein